jgi:uncharacterized protein (DUF2141 family)
MRKIIKMMILCLLSFSAVFAWQETNNTGDLVVVITGLENGEGKVMVALSNSEEDYDAKDKTFRGLRLQIQSLTAIGLFENIPHGEYAIKVYHDENDNDEIDSNFIGIPTEDYGFSNNASGSFGPASWDDARFLFNSTLDTLEIELN